MMALSATQIPLNVAMPLAEKYAEKIAEYCMVTQIVGSLRRRKEFVHDIDILVIPATQRVPDMFGAYSENISAFHAGIEKIVGDTGAHFIKNGPAFKSIMLAEGVQLDIFVSDIDRWPVDLTVRTGPAEFSAWIASGRRGGGCLPSYATMRAGRVWKANGVPIGIQTEEEFLRFLGLGWVEPADRVMGLPYK